MNVLSLLHDGWQSLRFWNTTTTVTDVCYIERDIWRKYNIAADARDFRLIENIISVQHSSWKRSLGIIIDNKQQKKHLCTKSTPNMCLKGFALSLASEIKTTNGCSINTFQCLRQSIEWAVSTQMSICNWQFTIYMRSHSINGCLLVLHCVACFAWKEVLLFFPFSIYLVFIENRTMDV